VHTAFAMSHFMGTQLRATPAICDHAVFPATQRPTCFNFRQLGRYLINLP